MQKIKDHIAEITSFGFLIMLAGFIFSVFEIFETKAEAKLIYDQLSVQLAEIRAELREINQHLRESR